MKQYLTIIVLAALMAVVAACDADNDAAGVVAGGEGGSTARFAIAGNTLYIVDTESLHAYDITTPGQPTNTATANLGIGIETVFPYQGYLYIGANDGMYIFDIAQPTQPQFKSLYTHITSCDPVVVQDTLAYVTLRDGTACRFGINVLDVVNVKDPENPVLLSSTPMNNPHGLDVDGNLLLVTEGEFGFRVMDLEQDPVLPRENAFVQGLAGYDVILRNNTMILTGTDGIYQFDYTRPDSLVLLSSLPTE